MRYRGQRKEVMSMEGDTPSVAAENFVATLARNVDNPRLSDTEFRAFVRDTLDIVIFPRPAPPGDTKGTPSLGMGR